MVTVNTGNTLRDTIGVGSIVNVHHEGTTKRPVEERVANSAFTSYPQKKKSTTTPMKNPSFGLGGGEAAKE